MTKKQLERALAQYASGVHDEDANTKGRAVQGKARKKKAERKIKAAFGALLDRIDALRVDLATAKGSLVWANRAKRAAEKTLKRVNTEFDAYRYESNEREADAHHFGGAEPRP